MGRRCRYALVVAATIATCGCNWVFGMEDVERKASTGGHGGAAGGSASTNSGNPSDGGSLSGGTPSVNASGGQGMGSGSHSGGAATGGNGTSGTGRGGESTKGSGGAVSSTCAEGGAADGEASLDCNHAGTTPDTALNLCTIPVEELLGCDGFVGSNNDDYFRFDFPEIGSLTFTLGVNPGARMTGRIYPYSLLPDLSPSAAIATVDTANGQTASVKLAAGSYFLRTQSSVQGMTYTLQMQRSPYAPPRTEPEPSPEPGNTPGVAHELGELGDGVVKYRGFVCAQGAPVTGADTDDYYRFQLTGNGTLTYSLENVENGPVTGRVYKDVNQLNVNAGCELNPPTDCLKQITSSAFEQASVTLEVGRYLVRVTSGTRALYTLGLGVAYQ